MERRFGQMSFSRLSLDLLKSVVEDDAYRAVLSALGSGIHAAGERAQSAGSLNGAPWADSVVDEECELIENLLGAAYVVCQVQITAVTSRALGVRERLVSQGYSFSAFGETKEAVRLLASPLPRNPKISTIETIWSLGNYFKHRDEWSTLDWSKLTGPSKQTADLIQRAGLEPGCSGNLRRGATALGNTTYDDVHALGELVDTWARAVLDACEKEVNSSISLGAK